MGHRARGPRDTSAIFPELGKEGIVICCVSGKRRRKERARAPISRPEKPLKSHHAVSVGFYSIWSCSGCVETGQIVESLGY